MEFWLLFNSFWDLKLVKDKAMKGQERILSLVSSVSLFWFPLVFWQHSFFDCIVFQSELWNEELKHCVAFPKTNHTHFLYIENNNGLKIWDVKKLILYKPITVRSCLSKGLTSPACLHIMSNIPDSLAVNNVTKARKFDIVIDALDLDVFG